jgi:hypothetical protein
MATKLETAFLATFKKAQTISKEESAKELADAILANGSLIHATVSSIGSLPKTDDLGALRWVKSAKAYYVWNGAVWNPLVSGGGGGAVTSVDGRTGVVTLSDLYKPIGYVPTWVEITGKPSTFTPSAHVHAWSDITSGKPTTLAGYGITDALNTSATNQTKVGALTAAYFVGGGFSAIDTVSACNIYPFEILINDTVSGGDASIGANGHALNGVNDAHVTLINSGGNAQLVPDKLSFGAIYLDKTRLTDLTDAGDSTLHYHASDRAWANLTGKPSTFTPSAHTHGNISNTGAIGSTANLPLITTTSGVVTVGSFGTTANTFCQGNDSRLSDARTPTAHTQAWSTITATPNNLAGYGITDAINTSATAQTKAGALTISGALKATAVRGILADSFSIESASFPSFSIVDLSAGGDAKRMRIASQGGSTYFGTRNDADTSGTDWVVFNRTGATPSDVTFPVPVIAPNATADTHALNRITADGRYALTAHNQAWSTITSTPNDLAGYGITDALNTSSTHQTKTGTINANGGIYATRATAGLFAFATKVSTNASDSLIIYANGDILLSDGAGLTLATITPLEFSYLDNATSNIQTQLNGKASTAHTQAWSTITTTPSTLAGYGITDALNTSSTAQTKEGALTLATPSATQQTLILPHGVAPTTPTNGSVWTTTSGVSVRINGSTRNVSLLEVAQTYSAVKTFSASPVISSTTASTTAGASYRRANTGMVDYDLMARHRSYVVFKGATASSAANTTTENGISTTAVFGTATMPANFFQAGTNLRIGLTLKAFSTIGSELTIRVKFGGVTRARYTVIPQNTAEEGYTLLFNFSANAVPSAASQVTPSLIGEIRGTFISRDMAPFDHATNASTAITMTMQWAVANAGNSCIGTINYMEVV